MLMEAMAALASAGGVAVVRAAGTDAWEGFRHQVARFFARGDRRREDAELERLDQTAAALESVDEGGAELMRIRQETSWQTRFETLLESMGEAERVQAAAQLRAILDGQGTVSGTVSGGLGGLAAAGNIDIRADDGSIAAGVIHGGAGIGTPTRPDPSQG